MKMYWTTFRTCDSSEKIKFSSVVAVDNIIYSIGSNFGGNEPIDIHILNTNTFIWSLLPDRIDINGKRLKPPDVPKKRYGHTVVAYDKKIYLWGGGNGNEAFNTLYSFDTETLSWSRPQVTGIIPSNRYFHSACISNAECKMYIFGGSEPNTDQLLRDVHCLDLKTMNWNNIITTGEMPLPRELHAATVVDNRMYIHGGKDSYNMYFTDTMYLDLKSNQWHRPETTGKRPDGDEDLSLFVHNDIIYVFGSCTGRNYRKFNDLYYLDTKRNHWNLINPPGKSPKERYNQSCIVIGDKMFLLHGTRPSHFVYRNKIHVLDLNPSLKTLAIISINKNGLDYSCLPTKLRCEVCSMGLHLKRKRN